jgi:hypothetical protein
MKGRAMTSRWASRKFLTTLAAQVGGMLVLIWPQKSGEIAAVVQSVTALAVVLLSALGYVSAEASVDRADRAAPPSGGDGPP